MTLDGLVNWMALLDQCIAERDVGLARAVLDDEYALLVTRPVITIVPRDHWLTMLPDYHVHEYTVQAQQVDVDTDCAAVSQIVAMRATVLGEDRSGTFVISDIWRKRESDWCIWRRHSTPLAAGAMPSTPGEKT